MINIRFMLADAQNASEQNGLFFSFVYFSASIRC